MTNPWLKPNPVLHLWIQTANTVASRATGHAASALRRQHAVLTRATTRAWTDAWLGAMKPKRRR